MKTQNNAAFWLALMEMGKKDLRGVSRTWNGYVGTRIEKASDQNIDPPHGGWPNLDKDEIERINDLAVRHGVQPEWAAYSMIFDGHHFNEDVDFTGLTLVNSSFAHAIFKNDSTFRNARFHGNTSFHSAKFMGTVKFDDALFGPMTSFDDASFHYCRFSNAQFNGFCSFGSVEFEGGGDLLEHEFHEWIIHAWTNHI